MMMFLFHVLLIQLLLVDGAPFDVATFWLDSACSISSNVSLFDSLITLNSSQTLTRLNDTYTPCIKRSTGYGRYRCQQSASYLLVDLIEWDDDDDINDCQTNDLPRHADRRFFSSISASPMSCITGVILSHQNQLNQSLMYAQFNCSYQPEDPLIAKADINLIQHRAIQANISAPIQHMRVYTDSTCMNEFEDDWSYLYTQDLMHEDVTSPEHINELHEWLAKNTTLPFICSVLPMPYRRSIEMFAFQGSQSQYGDHDAARISILHMNQWIQPGILFDSNFTSLCDGEPSITYSFVDMLTDSDACHEGTFQRRDGDTRTIWAQFQLSNGSSDITINNMWVLILSLVIMLMLLII